MFRFVRRAPSCILYRKYEKGPSRLYKTVRHYSRKEKELCPPPKPKPGSSGIYYTLGAFTLVTGATIGYAKYDKDFRDFVKEKAPFFDEFIKFLFQEDLSYYESIQEAYYSLLGRITRLMGGDDTGYVHKQKRTIQNIQEVEKDYKPPAPVLTEVGKEKKECEDIYTEVRLEKKEEGCVPDVEIVGDVKPPEKTKEEMDVADLEHKASETATKTIKAYNSAVYTLRNYSADVELAIENSADHLELNLQESLKAKRETRDETLKKADECAAEAQQYINKLKLKLSQRSFHAPRSTKEVAQLNIKKLEDDIKKAKEEVEHEKQVSNITDKYWERVEKARKHFAEDLEALFPTVNVKDKQLNIKEEDLSLFLLHAYKVIMFQQKEIAKMETLTDAKLRNAIDTAKKSGAPELLSEEQIKNAVDKELRQLKLCFQKKCMKFRCENEDELRRQLKRQSEAFSDHLKDALIAKETQMERESMQKFDEKLEEERCKFKIQMAAVVGRLKGLERSIDARASVDKMGQRAQILWSACQALYKTVQTSCPGVPWQDQIRKIDKELYVIEKAAEGDEMVETILKAIPKEACERGVFPEDALKERFLKVEKLARDVALLPEDGAVLPIHFLSLLQSMLLLKTANPIPQAELKDEVVDFSKLTTNEILQRARYWIDRGNLAQSLRYMNLLQGASRSVARQWMHETRLLLETQQAANTLMAHASSSGLLNL